MNNWLDAYCKGKEENPGSDVTWLESSTAECRPPEFLGLGQSLSLTSSAQMQESSKRKALYMLIKHCCFFTLSSWLRREENLKHSKLR